MRSQPAHVLQTWGRAYMRLNPEGRHRFLSLMADEFGTDLVEVDAGMEAVRNAADPIARRAAEMHLRDVLRPPRVTLLMQFNGLPEGVKFLVDLRAELMNWTKKEPNLEALSQDARRLLATWFDIGFSRNAPPDLGSPSSAAGKTYRL